MKSEEEIGFLVKNLQPDKPINEEELKEAIKEINETKFPVDWIKDRVKNGRIGIRVMSLEEKKLAATIGEFHDLLFWIKDHEERVGEYGALYHKEIQEKCNQIKILFDEIVDLMFSRC